MFHVMLATLNDEVTSLSGVVLHLTGYFRVEYTDIPTD